MIKYNKFFKNPKFVAHQHFKECHEVLKKIAPTNCLVVVLYYSLKFKRDIPLILVINQYRSFHQIII